MGKRHQAILLLLADWAAILLSVDPVDNKSVAREREQSTLIFRVMLSKANGLLIENTDRVTNLTVTVVTSAYQDW